MNPDCIYHINCGDLYLKTSKISKHYLNVYLSIYITFSWSISWLDTTYTHGYNNLEMFIYRHIVF